MPAKKRSEVIHLPERDSINRPQGGGFVVARSRVQRLVRVVKELGYQPIDLGQVPLSVFPVFCELSPAFLSRLTQRRHGYGGSGSVGGPRLHFQHPQSGQYLGANRGDTDHQQLRAASESEALFGDHELVESPNADMRPRTRWVPSTAARECTLDELRPQRHSGLRPSTGLPSSM